MTLHQIVQSSFTHVLLYTITKRYNCTFNQRQIVEELIKLSAIVCSAATLEYWTYQVSVYAFVLFLKRVDHLFKATSFLFA